MPRGVILVDCTDQGRRTIKDSPDRAEASSRSGRNWMSRSKTSSIPKRAEGCCNDDQGDGPEPINKFMLSVQSLRNVKMEFFRAFSIEQMREMI